MFKTFNSITPKHVFFVTALGLFLAAGAQAQTTLEELKAHPEYTSSNYLAYPEPDRNVKYTKAPKGYKPFYISHYGRHGSRYHHSADEYNYLFETLQKADAAKALTLDGKRLLIASQILAKKAAPRAGDLTQAGAKQHEGIAKRMAKNFPELFKVKKVKGKKIQPHVDAYASTSGRCIVSMSAFAAGLSSVAPDVDIRMESGKDLMSFICTFDWGNMDYTRPEAYITESDKLWNAIDSKPLINKLFSDSAYVDANLDANNFYNKLFEIVASMQGMDAPLKDVIHANLCDVKTGKCNDILDSLFTVEESITRWKAQNSWWYSLLGTSPLQNTTKGIDYAKGTLENIISEANHAIALDAAKSLTEHTVATLRFGHDAGLLPLAGLMQLSVSNAKVSDLSTLHEQWTDFKVIPMAANLQMVFYKNPKKSDDILVKFLYNEREVTAPIPCSADIETAAGQNVATTENVAAANSKETANPKQAKKPAKKQASKCPAAPYYRWDDVKDFYKKILTSPSSSGN